MSDFQYVGEELKLFAAARNWKEYWSSTVRPFISGDVVEVGAGIGTNTPLLDMGTRGRWICLEPDMQLVQELKLAQRPGRVYENVVGTLASLPREERYDTLIYIDVLEHIEDDRGELLEAANRLRPGGRIIVLSPAHQRLYTPFDKAIGHFRRYSRAMLRNLTPPGLSPEKIVYLDSVGLLASTANLLIMKQSMPTAAQLRLWDRVMIPCSRILDPMFGYSAGKTVIGIWRKS